ncbi:MAG: hypothetical protein J6S92_10240 [Oscillospiraceae bacterium]|nr:hypothetical protein [Oscillospiraceae bacterium]
MPLRAALRAGARIPLPCIYHIRDHDETRKKTQHRGFAVLCFLCFEWGSIHAEIRVRFYHWFHNKFVDLFEVDQFRQKKEIRLFTESGHGSEYRGV